MIVIVRSSTQSPYAFQPVLPAPVGDTPAVPARYLRSNLPDPRLFGGDRPVLMSGVMPISPRDECPAPGTGPANPAGICRIAYEIQGKFPPNALQIPLWPLPA